MTREELDKLKYALAGMCSVMGVKPLDDAGMAYWTMTLKDCDYQDIRQALFDWGQKERFCPKPAEILQMVKAKKNAHQPVEVEEQKNYEPMSPEVAAEFESAMKRAANRALPSDAWAYRNRIKEAYGFHLCPFAKTAWRKALGLAENYNFEDTNGVFPLDDYPDERTSLYHDCQMLFLLDYEPKHGLKLEYDKELAFKRYPNRPQRFNGRGEPVTNVVA